MSDFDLSLRPAEAHPIEFEHLPVAQSFNGLVEYRLAMAEPDPAMIGDVTGGRRAERLSDLGVIEWGVSR